MIISAKNPAWHKRDIKWQKYTHKESWEIIGNPALILDKFI